MNCLKCKHYVKEGDIPRCYHEDNTYRKNYMTYFHDRPQFIPDLSKCPRFEPKGE
jgi:hypothetical protein